MFAYTRAPVVKAGDPISAQQAAQFADACNSRLRLGHGPSNPWRIMFYLLSAFRQMRNPFQDLFASQAEFFTAYQPINPRVAQWPEAGPGDPEGSNLVSQWPLFVFGFDPFLEAEADRLGNSNVGGFNFALPARSEAGPRPNDLWNLAKRQRGAWDPATGEIGSPALHAAQSHAYVHYGRYSPHGLDWGDFLAGPQYNGVCGGGSPPPPSITYIFTSLAGAPRKTYGSCPENDGDIAAIAETPFSYTLVKWGGAIETLSKLAWVAGPYTSNPRLTKTPNNFIERGMQRFCGDFRGTESQIDEGGLANAFPFQRFLSSQYLLAPQRGYSVGNNVAPQYYRFTATFPAGVSPAQPFLGARVAAGHVVTAAYVQSSSGPITVSVLRDGAVIAALTTEPQVDGTWQAMAILPTQTAGGRWTMALAAPASFPAGGSAWGEITELMPYWPGVPDAYLTLRIGGVDIHGTVDGSGQDCAFADQIGANYFAEGVLRSNANTVALPGSEQAINTNSVFDAGRRLSQCIRWVPRANFIAMAVQNGQTVLWFKRYANGLGHAVKADLFAGIGPAPTAIPSGAIKWGRKYTVVAAGKEVLVYNGKTYGNGQTFLATRQPDYTGKGMAYEADGIRGAAEPGDIDNRWIMGIDLKAYRDSSSSIWKPDAYADIFATVNRCLLCDPGVALDPVVLAHLAYGQAVSSPPAVLTPEAPEYANYVPTPNAGNPYHRANYGASGDFYQSCPVSHTWPDVVSVVTDPTMGSDVVKVTLASRLHFNASADASYTNDISTWNLANLDAEGPATWDNCLRRYLLFVGTGRNSPIKTGDQSYSQNCASFPDAPYGSVFPTFWCLQLIPTPYIPAPGATFDDDTKTFHDVISQAELYLRAIAPGYCDGQTTASLACTDNTTDWFSFTYEELLRQTSGGRWVSPLAWTSDAMLGAGDIAPTRPQGYGPLPTCAMAAQAFNQIGAAFNALTTFRVMIPADLEIRTAFSTITTSAAPIMNGAGAVTPPASAQLSGSHIGYAVYYSGSFATAPDGAWSDWTSIGSGVSAYETAQLDQVAGAWVIGSAKSSAQYRWSPQGGSEAAIPPDWLDMLTGAPAMFGIQTTSKTSYTLERVIGATNGTQCHPGTYPGPEDIWTDGAGGACQWQSASPTTNVCVKAAGGVLDPGGIPSGYAWVSVSTDGLPSLCHGGPTASIAFTPYNSTTPAIDVPLRDVTFPAQTPFPE